MKESEMIIKENQMRAAREKIPITLKIPAQLYKTIQAAARSSGRENWKFFNNNHLDCKDCPARPSCQVKEHTAAIFSICGKEVCDLACYGAFIKFVFAEAE